MRRLTTPLALPAAVLLLLTACVDEPGTTPELPPTSAPSPTPSATPGETTPTPDPTEPPVVIDCVSLVPAASFSTLFRTFTLVPGYAPAAGSPAAEVLTRGGTVCGWQATDGTIVTVGVASIDEETLNEKANELVVSSNSVPTYGVEGYFQVTNGVGEVQAFDPPYWIIATSTAFAEPGEPAPIIASVLERLP